VPFTTELLLTQINDPSDADPEPVTYANSTGYSGTHRRLSTQKKRQPIHILQEAALTATYTNYNDHYMLFMAMISILTRIVLPITMNLHNAAKEVIREDEIRRGLKSETRIFCGINCDQLLDFDPQQILVPLLHCPMGLIDKVFETFSGWVGLYVERYEENETDEKETRALYRHAMKFVDNTEILVLRLQSESETVQRNEDLKKAKETKKAASKAHVKVK
jgi:hypothetical protein